MLHQAAAEPIGSMERLLYVAAYTIAPYSLQPPDRTNKPLDAQLNETFEADHRGKGVRYVCEAVRELARRAYGDDWPFRLKMCGREVQDHC
jgi:hypothetical protein